MDEHIHKAIATPLREKCDCYYNPHTSTVPGSLDELEPSCLILELLILNCSSYFIELELNEWIISTAVSMVVRQNI